MLRLSLSTFRDRWQLFVGAVITVATGVALVQSSLLNLVTVASGDVPAHLPELDAARLADASEGAIALLGVMVGFSVFLAAFIVSSTFAFTVAQRRKDLAMVRLSGGLPSQVRRLLLGEATLLGLIGTAAGVPIGLLVMDLQAWLLTSLDLLPASFEPEWLNWVLGVSAGVGVLVAVAGVSIASRRAAKIRALEALRETGAAARVMSAGRWLFALLFLGGATAMTIVAGVAGPTGAVALAVNATLAASVALALTSPLVVPVVSRAFGWLLRGSTLAGLAEANLRDGVRRSASMAAPLLVLAALLIAQVAAQASVSAAVAAEQSRTTRADVVVDSANGNGLGRLADIPGVATVSTERAVAITATHVVSEDDESEETSTLTTALAVDAAAYSQVHRVAADEGSLSDLRGDTVAIGPGYDGDEDYEVGDTLQATIDGQQRQLRVVALMGGSLSESAQYLLPAELAPSDAPAVSFLRADGDVQAVLSAARAADVGTVSPAQVWLNREAAQQQETQQSIALVVLGLGGLYALIAVINAVVIATAERKREFAAARVTGLSRAQVVRSALIESAAVTGIGLLLGGLASASTLLGISAATAEITGEAHVIVPLGLVAAVMVGGFVVVGATTLWASLAATRRRPIGLIGARE